eukprot:PRCOL_00004737-RA
MERALAEAAVGATAGALPLCGASGEFGCECPSSLARADSDGSNAPFLEDTAMTFTDLNWRLALLALFFVALVLVLLAVRSVKLLRRSCDPCVFIDAENRLYPP